VKNYRASEREREREKERLDEATRSRVDGLVPARETRARVELPTWCDIALEKSTEDGGSETLQHLLSTMIYLPYFWAFLCICYYSLGEWELSSLGFTALQALCGLCSLRDRADTDAFVFSYLFPFSLECGRGLCNLGQQVGIKENVCLASDQEKGYQYWIYSSEKGSTTSEHLQKYLPLRCGTRGTIYLTYYCTSEKYGVYAY
jgi:hypothetical protein